MEVWVETDFDGFVSTTLPSVMDLGFFGGEGGTELGLGLPTLGSLGKDTGRILVAVSMQEMNTWYLRSNIGLIHAKYCTCQNYQIIMQWLMLWHNQNELVLKCTNKYPTLPPL